MEILPSSTVSPRSGHGRSVRQTEGFKTQVPNKNKKGGPLTGGFVIYSVWFKTLRHKADPERVKGV